MIERIRATNFKSFKSIDVKLTDLNVLIGQNSSGKSNFVSIFQFIRDISTVGLNNALSMQGGVEYLFNFDTTADGFCEVEVFFDRKVKLNIRGRSKNKYDGLMKMSMLSYKLRLTSYKSVKKIKTFREEIKLMLSYSKEKDPINKEIIVVMENGNVNVEGDKDEVLKNMMVIPMGKSSELLTLLRLPPFIFLFDADLRGAIQVYDFDPKLSKKAISLTGKMALEPDGSNIALVLRHVLNDNDERKKFIRYLKSCLPFINDISIVEQIDKSIIFKTSETYNSNSQIPAPLISDGTVEIVSIIYCLFFQHNELIIIEEPERNIHPHLISSVMHLIREASDSKQIIITTHSPELLKQVDLRNIYIVDRDKRGASKVNGIENIQEIKIFLRDKIGVDELFIDGILR